MRSFPATQFIDCPVTPVVRLSGERPALQEPFFMNWHFRFSRQPPPPSGVDEAAGSLRPVRCVTLQAKKDVGSLARWAHTWAKNVYAELVSWSIGIFGSFFLLLSCARCGRLSCGHCLAIAGLLGTASVAFPLWTGGRRQPTPDNKLRDNGLPQQSRFDFPPGF